MATAQGTVPNPTQNPVLAGFGQLTSAIVDVTTQAAQAATATLDVLNAWNQAKQNAKAPVKVPSTINDPPAAKNDQVTQLFFYLGVTMMVVAGGVFIYKQI